MSATQSRPRGGVILSVTKVGTHGQYSELWTICPQTHEERVITVWTTEEHDPQPGDEVWWHSLHSPGWRKRGTEGRTAFLPRIGRSYDPTKR
jgi:hypothetical protein